MKKSRLTPFFGALAVMPAPAMAQDGRIDLANSGDTAWIMACAALVLLLFLPGIALYNSGRADARNGLSVLIQSAAVVAAVTLLWPIVGYTLAFGDVTNGWLGSGNAWMLGQLGNVREGTSTPESAFALFQIALAGLAPALMIGAWAERARFGWVVAFCALWTLVVQAPIAHWIWGGGWLARRFGVLDWSGGLAIFASAGVSALVVVAILGRRIGFPGDLSQPRSPALSLTGAALAWIGALGLCGGWALAANDDAAAAMIAAHIAIAAAGLTWVAAERWATGRVTAEGMAKGILAGMATIAPAAGYVSPGAAIVFGVIGALSAYHIRPLIRRSLRLDDACDIFAIPGLCGMLGSLLLGPFLSTNLGGVGYSGNNTMISQAISQSIGLGAVILWAAPATAIVALMASLAFPMRVSEDAERAGLDQSSHGSQSGDNPS